MRKVILMCLTVVGLTGCAMSPYNRADYHHVHRAPAKVVYYKKATPAKRAPAQVRRPKWVKVVKAPTAAEPVHTVKVVKQNKTKKAKAKKVIKKTVDEHEQEQSIKVKASQHRAPANIVKKRR